MYELDTNIQHTRKGKEFFKESCTYENKIVIIKLTIFGNKNEQYFHLRKCNLTIMCFINHQFYSFNFYRFSVLIFHIRPMSYWMQCTIYIPFNSFIFFHFTIVCIKYRKYLWHISHFLLMLRKYICAIQPIPTRMRRNGVSLLEYLILESYFSLIQHKKEEKMQPIFTDEKML